MEHPLKDKKFIFYSGLWIFIMILHAIFLFHQFDFPIVVSITDSILFNSFIAGGCFAYWSVVKYISPQKQGITETIISHFIGIGFFVVSLTYVSGNLLQMIFNEDEVYHYFLREAFLFRVILGILYFTIILMLYYLLIYVDNINEQHKKEAELQNQLKQTSLDMLLFQINPHFLFNSLNSISSLTITAPSQAREMVIKLADFFRASLRQNNGDLQSLEEELKQMKLYLEIEKIRFEDRLLIEADVEDACLQLQLPKMILQPLYENAIKFGVYEHLENVTIKTVCTCRDGNLKISITNNSHENSIPKKGTGVGIKNVKDRLKLFYGIDNLVEVIHQYGLFSIDLTIPQKATHD